ncbi:hypothetical protein SRS16CHR_00649 [Variovorax sp. SRS16]|uniref:SdrD B-like domain-containing protein n=1 Tax=Variovorax sp. SRS16 TaxID=282217 RepID=UPI0013192CB9|nr:SdrD B-like domain-containing protein [Variovorax sp. SRS16]VTU13555.1 hypothetical protein SRS16CHR_00649 [Variovorax sp. SRS16]
MRLRIAEGVSGICCAWAMLAPGVASAQTPATVPAQPEAASTYVDRVLDSGAPSTQPDEPEQPSTGWPRGWSIEGQSTRQSGQSRAASQSLLFSGFLDTPNYGAFSTNLNLNRNTVSISGFGVTGSTGMPFSAVPFNYSTGSTWRIDQRGMPFDGGWLGNTSVGNINMASTPLARGVGRVFLPGSPIEGVAASLEQPGHTSFNVSAGRLGYFNGLSSQGFSASQGTAASAGAQTQLSGGEGPLALGRIDAAAQLIETRGVDLNGVQGFAQDTRSVWAAVAWQGLTPWADTLGTGFGGVADKIGGMRVQANVVQSSGRPSDSASMAPRDSATGTWVDATWRTQLMQQAASVFYFEPSLRWGAEQLPSDLRGASWRGDIGTRQWQLGTSVEFSDSVSGLQRPSLFANVFGRWRFDSRDSVSGTLAARAGSFAAQSASLTWEHKSDWGYSQWRTDLARGVDLRVIRSGVDHAWAVGESQTLSTSLAFQQSNTQGVSTRTVYWGLLGTTPLVAGARLDLSLRGSNGTGETGSRFESANVRVNWPIGHGWSFIAQYTSARGQESQNPAVVSALTAATLQPTPLLPASRSLMIALRYEDRAGVTTAPIGGAPGGGSGRVEGHVFFDQNNNGQREASEGGVAGVTVLLDRRYVARTDAQGFYSFPSVAGGSHELELVQDDLPLPWSSPGSPSRRVDVYVRDTLPVDFPVQKER